MSGCLRARQVVVRVRNRSTREARDFDVVVPGWWTKAAFLRYVRSEHPDSTVRIVNWMPMGWDDDPWEQRLWLANPEGFRDYARATL